MLTFVLSVSPISPLTLDRYVSRYVSRYIGHATFIKSVDA